MAGDFVVIRQASVPAITGSSTPCKIPTMANLISYGFPQGQSLVLRVSAQIGCLYKLGGVNDIADKTIGSDYYYPPLNTYAEKGAIETFKMVPNSASQTPSYIHTIADTANGRVRYAFGYYE